MTLVYLDTETTGLDPDRHEIWEIAYAVDDEFIRHRIVRHSIDTADAEALKIGGHTNRCNHIAHPVEHYLRFEADGFEGDLIEELRSSTLVGANPAFDTAMLRARWKAAPWKYRLFDIEAYAMPALGLDEPKGLAYICEQLDVTPGDHTAAGDVRALRECHRALKAIYAGARYGQEPAL